MQQDLNMIGTHTEESVDKVRAVNFNRLSL